MRNATAPRARAGVLSAVASRHIGCSGVRMQRNASWASPGAPLAPTRIAPAMPSERDAVWPRGGWPSQYLVAPRRLQSRVHNARAGH